MIKLAAVLSLCMATVLPAQNVRGVVREGGSGPALHGVFVTLVDSLQHTRTATLTNQSGEYVLRVPFAGTFTVRAELIGHQTITNTFVSSQTPTIATILNFTVPVQAIVLDKIEVGGAKRCVARPDAALQTARVWDEVRKALRVNSWVGKQDGYVVESLNYTRRLDPYTMKPVWERSHAARTRDRAWEAISPDTLALYGFSRTLGGDSVYYYGPDADVLLSEAFLDTHCFELQRGTEKNEGLIGLSFRPIPKRKQPEIAGTLWVDAKTTELRHIDYRFTALPRGIESTALGGRTEFTRLLGGAWVVSKWYIRLPVAGRDMRGDVRLIGISEEGGEIVGARPTGNRSRRMEE